jgi:O-methyltransferase involved in polyketide biosynthesis
MATASIVPPSLVGHAGGDPADGTGGAGDDRPPTSQHRSLADRAGDLLASVRARIKYGPGASDVGFLSSRLVAARRAMESEDEPAPLFRDGLAGALVGRRIMRAARAGAAAGRPGIDAAAGGGTGAGGGGRRRAAVSRIAARTLWFDAEVEGAVAGAATSRVKVGLEVGSSQAGRPVRVTIAPATHAPATQGVCLGAGMDTRAWRPLEGAGGLAWFEVDAGRVLRAKAVALAAARAEAPRWGGVAVTHTAAGPAPAAAPSPFPLTVRSYAALEADLGVPGWGGRLVRECRFDASAPAVFLAEGLVMYLTAPGVASLLSEAASIAAPGSILAVVAATEAAAQAARARSGGRGIMAAWTWGCPQDPAALWAAHGWAVEAVVTRSDIARRWGLAWTEFPVAPAAPGGRGRVERESLFIVAVRARQ